MKKPQNMTHWDCLNLSIQFETFSKVWKLHFLVLNPLRLKLEQCEICKALETTRKGRISTKPESLNLIEQRQLCMYLVENCHFLHIFFKNKNNLKRVLKFDINWSIPPNFEQNLLTWPSCKGSPSYFKDCMDILVRYISIPKSFSAWATF